MSDSWRLVRVYEAGSGKWVCTDGPTSELVYTSDINEATIFTLPLLKSADQCFGDFSIYKSTLHAVPTRTNEQPWDCSTVKNYIKDHQDQEDYDV